MFIAENNFRFQSDKRQIGGLLMLLSFCALVMPLATIVGNFGPDGTTTNDAMENAKLAGAFFLFFIGLLGLFVGYMATVHDWSNGNLNLTFMVLIQGAWIAYITNMVDVGQMAGLDVVDNEFIPLAYGPTTSNVRFVGAMGVIGIMTYAFGFIGSIAFMAWSLHSYTLNKPEERTAPYFKGRMFFYSSVLAVAGSVQFLLGAVVAGLFGGRDLFLGPVTAGFFVISYPGLFMFVGLWEMLNGFWGMARSFDILNFQMDVPIYQLSLGVQWLFILFLQDIVQLAYLPDGSMKAAAVAMAIPFWTLGLTIMPAYLDHKMNTLPETLPDDYYGAVSTEAEEEKAAVGVEAPMEEDVEAKA